MQRFLQAIHDTNGVTACNKAGRRRARAKGIAASSGHDVDIPARPGQQRRWPQGILGTRYGSSFTTFGECEVFKIDNLAAFYLDSIVGTANLYFRDNFIRNGEHLGRRSAPPPSASSRTRATSATTRATPTSTTAPTSTHARLLGHQRPARPSAPSPAWLDRLVFFDIAGDSPTPGQTNYTTNHFLTDLQGTQIGAAICPERRHPRSLRDEQPRAPARPTSRADGMVHGLRCVPHGRLALPPRPGRDVRLGGPRLLRRDHAAGDGVRDAEQPHDGAAPPPRGSLHRPDGGAAQALAVAAGRRRPSRTSASLHASAPPPTAARTAPTPTSRCSAQIFSSDMLTALHDLVNDRRRA